MLGSDSDEEKKKKEKKENKILDESSFKFELKGGPIHTDML